MESDTFICMCLAARPRVRCSSISRSNPSWSTAIPSPRRMSSVRSTGKPYVSYKRKATSPDSDFPPDLRNSASESSSSTSPLSRVSAKRPSSARTVPTIRSASVRNSG